MTLSAASQCSAKRAGGLTRNHIRPFYSVPTDDSSDKVLITTKIWQQNIHRKKDFNFFFPHRFSGFTTSTEASSKISPSPGWRITSGCIFVVIPPFANPEISWDDRWVTINAHSIGPARRWKTISPLEPLVCSSAGHRENAWEVLYENHPTPFFRSRTLSKYFPPRQQRL